MWDRVVEQLPDGVKVSVPALPGHGDGTRSTFTDHARAADAVAVELGLAHAGAPVTVAGFSLGGQTAIRLTSAYPQRVERLVVVSSLLRPMPGAGAAAAVVRASAPLARQPWFARLQARQLGVPDEWFDRYLRTVEGLSPSSLANLTRANSTFDAEPLLARVTCPVQLLCGSKEPGAVGKGMRAVSSRSSDVDLTVVRGVGHTLPLTHPEVVARSIMGG